MCYYCDSPVNNAEHALFVCAKWGAAREALGQAVGAEPTADTLVLSDVPVWAVLDANRVIRHTSDEDERARWALERNNGEGQ